MQQHELDFIVKESTVSESGTKELYDVELYATSVVSCDRAYPFLQTQLIRPRREEKRKKHHWFKRG